MNRSERYLKKSSSSMASKKMCFEANQIFYYMHACVILSQTYYFRTKLIKLSVNNVNIMALHEGGEHMQIAES